MLRFFTAGESHGQALVAGFPGCRRAWRWIWHLWIANCTGGNWDLGAVDGKGLRKIGPRCWLGSGTGGRLGRRLRCESRIAIGRIGRRRCRLRMSNAEDARRTLTAPRPGHADLAGALKFNFHDARYILERASARETAARVAAGALAKLLLREFGVRVLSHTIGVGRVRLERAARWEDIEMVCENLESPLRCVDDETEGRMKAEVDHALRAGDSVGGIFEVVARGLPPGLGSHAQWDEKLDGRLAQAVMSIQAVKAVEIGEGVAAASSPGSEVQDEIAYNAGKKRFHRSANRAGGLEGGITNGEDLVVRGYLKPISTLRRPLLSADLVTKEPVKAAYERSDVCVVPAGGVAGEAMVAFVLAAAFLEKFGGDSIEETRRNYDGYQRQLDEF